MLASNRQCNQRTPLPWEAAFSFPRKEARLVIPPPRLLTHSGRTSKCYGAVEYASLRPSREERASAASPGASFVFHRTARGSADCVVIAPAGQERLPSGRCGTA